MTNTTPSTPPTELAPDDPRTPFAAAVRTAGDVLAGVSSAQHTAPTPCADWDVETLARHEVDAPVIDQMVAWMGRNPA